MLVSHLREPRRAEGILKPTNRLVAITRELFQLSVLQGPTPRIPQHHLLASREVRVLERKVGESRVFGAESRHAAEAADPDAALRAATSAGVDVGSMVSTIRDRTDIVAV